MIIKCKTTGVLLRVEKIAARKPDNEDTKNYVVMCHDVDQRLYIMGLAEMMKNYDFVTE